MARLGSRLLTLTIDGTSYTAEVTSAKITSAAAASGDVSFAEAAAGGGRQYTLNLKFFQDPAASTLWDKVWSAAGTTVPVVIFPNGGTIDATHPSITGNVVISEPDGDLIGGDASGDSTVRWVTECAWLFEAKPVRHFS